MSEHATDGEMAAIARREMEQRMVERRARPMTAIPITPSAPPTFPCWLWDEVSATWSHWGQYTYAIPRTLGRSDTPAKMTHWHPDQAEAPAARPSVPKPAQPIRMVVCAANRIFIVGQPNPYTALGPRHFSPTMHLHIAAWIAAGCGTHADWRSSTQGFIDQHGVFLTREEAWVVASAAGQVRYGPHLGGGRLDSSDLY